MSKLDLSKLWIGIAKSHSADLGFMGAHDLTGKLYNAIDVYPNIRNGMININGIKYGPGLGGSISAVFVIANGYATLKEAEGNSESWDFDVALGAKLDSFLKGMRRLGTAIDGLDKYKEMHYLAENMIKNMGITKKGIFTFPIPVMGGGAHLWAGYKKGEIRILTTGIGVP